MFDHTANFAASNILSIKMSIISITQIWKKYIRFVIQQIGKKHPGYDWDWISTSATLISNQMLQWTFISSPSFLFMTTTQKRDYNDEKRCKMHVFLSTDFILFFLCNQHTSLAVVVRNNG